MQEDSCFICDFPIILGCHLHHLIPHDVQGPDHILNLIGLCPNHHKVFESVRRNVAPKEAQRSTAWLQRGRAALQVVEALPEDQRQLFNDLSEPYPLREVIKAGVDSEFRITLAEDIARKDAQLLLKIYKVRPSMVLLWRIQQAKIAEPRTEDDWDKAIIDTRETLCTTDFREVVMRHLHNLDLPFESTWLEE